MNLFETVKDNVTTRQAAERYGLQVGRSGMCKCPFHPDKNPSMKLDRRYHCFGCQADGDVISFTARLFSLSPKDAALKLADDFGIQYDAQRTIPYVRKYREVSSQEILEHQVSYCFSELASYRNLLAQWLQEYAPKTPDDELHPRFLEALRNIEIVEYELDTLLSGDDSDKKQIVTDFLTEGREKRKEVFHMDSIVKTPVYHQSAAYAREHGELEQYRQSHHANIDCKKDIEKSIANHFDGIRLEKSAVTEVMDKYGSERVALVLAATVQVKSWDGRFSSSNKDWAFTFDFPDSKTALGTDRRDDYAVTSHPAVLDGFINTARKEIRELEQMVKNEMADAEIPLQYDSESLSSEADNIAEERKYTVLLTDEQEVKVLECDPQEEIFSIARGTIGCDWIELVEAPTLAENNFLFLIDEEGKLHGGQQPINCIASDLYSSDQHGDPIIGNAMIVKAASEQLELLTSKEANDLASNLGKMRDVSIEKICRAFGIKPTTKPDQEKNDPTWRQPCKKASMER